MSEDNQSSKAGSGKSIHTAVALIWAAVMVIVTFTVDKPGNVVPFWLLLIAYYITVWGRSAHRP